MKKLRSKQKKLSDDKIAFIQRRPYGTRTMAKMLKVDRSTILYHLSAKKRSKHKARIKKWYLRTRPIRLKQMRKYNRKKRGGEKSEQKN